MKITLLTVGKTDKDWVRQGLDIYVSRLKHYIPFGIVEIPELKNVSALSKEQIKNKEYSLPFERQDRTIIKIGASVSRDTRNIEDWIIE